MKQPLTRTAPLALLVAGIGIAAHSGLLRGGEGEAEARGFRPPVRFARLIPPNEATAWQLAEWSFEPFPAPANPCDPDELRIDMEIRAPSGNVVVRPAYYDQPHIRYLDEREVEQVVPVGRASWKVRFTPREAGRHEWRLVAGADGVDEAFLRSGWHALDVAEGTPGGFVRVSESDRRFFEDAAGKFFYPIGQNIHNPYDVRVADALSMPVLPNRGTFAYDYYFSKMGATGQNAIVMWMSNWWVCIEWSDEWKGFRGLTDYNLGNAWRLDTVFESAARNGISINLVLDNHGKLKSSAGVETQWPTNPYNAANGGPARTRTPEDFFTDAGAFHAYKKRLRYIVARWGAHPNLLGLQLFSEINLTDASGASHVSWMKKASAHLREIDAYRHPVSLHWTNDWTAVNPDAAAAPELDYVLVNAYKGDGSIVPMMLEIAKQNARFKKPSFTAEYGGNWNGGTHARVKSDIHSGLWASIMTDSAGAPFCWWFDFIDHYDMNTHLAAVAKFMEDEDYRCFAGVTRSNIAGRAPPLHVKREPPPTPSSEGNATENRLVDAASTLVGVAYTDNQRGNFWVADRAASEIWPETANMREYEGAWLEIPGFLGLPGPYRVEFWDTAAGEILSAAEATVDDVAEDGTGTLRIPLPRFRNDIAGKIRPADE